MSFLLTSLSFFPINNTEWVKVDELGVASHAAALSHVALTRVAGHEGGKLNLGGGSSNLQHHILEAVEGGALGVDVVKLGQEGNLQQSKDS